VAVHVTGSVTVRPTYTNWRDSPMLLWGLPNPFGSKTPAPMRGLLARRRPLLQDPRVMRMALRGQTNHPFRLQA
jgi:hypothetical protein